MAIRNEDRLGSCYHKHNVPMKSLLNQFISSDTKCEPLLVHVVSSLVGRDWDKTTSLDIVELIDLIYAVYNRDIATIMKFLLKNKNFQNCSLDRLPKLQAELAASETRAKKKTKVNSSRKSRK